MVTPAVAKKHQENMEREQYLKSLGRDPGHATDLIPPITTESIFGPSPPSPPADIDDGMDLDTTFPPVEPSPPLPATDPDFHFPSHQHPILDDDFVPDVDPDLRPGSPEEYDEDLERSALEEELWGLEDIEYGSPSILMDVMLRCSSSFLGGNLHEFDISICKAFAWLIRSGVSKKMFSAIPDGLSGFVGNTFPSEYLLRAHAKELAGVEPVRYDCCVNSCICYAGHYRPLEKCPRCNEPRFSGHDSHGNRHPRRQFLYIPLIPRLRAFLQTAHMAELLQYRSTRAHVPDVSSDIFDGEYYHQLRSTPITVHGKPINPPANYFEDDRDIALGLSTDGYGIFSSGQATAWPLVIFLYNLPPELQVHVKHLLALGVIPGPNKPAEIDSFLIPLHEELFQLAKGVDAYDIQSKKSFLLHAFLLLIFGDFPAVSMVMNMKGVNGLSPCRNCKITAIPIPSDTNHTHYVPLTTDLTGLGRNHMELMADAKWVDEAETISAANRIAKETGIKGTPLLSTLDYIAFPQSFPLDFMHIAWENVVKTLVGLWTNNYKGIGEGKESYHIGAGSWKTIGADGAASGSTIPSAYSPHIPDVSKKGSYLTADMWSFWTLYLAPVLLRNQFKKPEYFTHFVELVRLFRICLQFDISVSEIQELKTGFIKWVEEYKRYRFSKFNMITMLITIRIYYQDNLNRLPVCTLPIHSLLHIADCIKGWGPVWCYWAFPMERFCGHLKRGGVTSKRYPYSSLDRYLMDWATLWHIGNVHGINDELRFKSSSRAVQHHHRISGCGYHHTPIAVSIG